MTRAVIEDVFQANKGKVGIVLYSVVGKKMMNGRPVTLSEGILKLKDKAWVSRRSEVNKAVRALLKQHAAKGDDPAGCSFYVIKEDGDVQLCSMAYAAGEYSENAPARSSPVGGKPRSRPGAAKGRRDDISE